MKALRILLIWLVTVTSSAALPATDADKNVVLVISSQSTPPKTFSASELRRLFLGVPVRRGGERVMPLINATDAALYQAFLQKIVFMSEVNYQRQLMLRVFRRGGERPPVYQEEAELIQMLAVKPLGVTFMTQAAATRTPAVEVVQPLW